jgi:hypothetical protein
MMVAMTALQEPDAERATARRWNLVVVCVDAALLRIDVARPAIAAGLGAAFEGGDLAGGLAAAGSAGCD